MFKAQACEIWGLSPDLFADPEAGHCTNIEFSFHAYFAVMSLSGELIYVEMILPVLPL